MTVLKMKDELGSRYVICRVSKVSDIKSYALGSLLATSIYVILAKLLSAGENSNLIQPGAFTESSASC